MRQAVMHDNENILEVENLKTWFYTETGVAKSVNGISFAVPAGKTVALVGESGCGKSVTSLSIMRLLQEPAGRIVDGTIRFNRPSGPVDLVTATEEEMEQVRGGEIAMIFQEPMTSLNPVFTVGNQIDEMIGLHNPMMTKTEIREQTVRMLKLVGIPRAEGIYKSYPHELSGGMRQRVMIAMAISCNPELIIADEPTTALDVTIQAQILELMKDLKDRIGAGILLITHDLGVVAEMADEVIVMYAGRIVEKGTVMEVLLAPKHPYTKGLIKSKPAIGTVKDKLYSIPGTVVSPAEMPDYCAFYNRCGQCAKECQSGIPDLEPFGDTHFAACYRIEGGNEAEAVTGESGRG